jgi:uncharacterized OB-fold protein
MSDYTKPLPVTKGVASKFWESLKNGEFLYQKCETCDHTFFYPRVVCPNCMSDQLTWNKSSNQGEIYSYTVVYRPVDPRFKADAPYVVALVNLAEGVRVMGNVLDVAEPEQLQIGQRVEIVFDKVTEDVTLPMFRVVEEVTS